MGHTGETAYCKMAIITTDSVQLSEQNQLITTRAVSALAFSPVPHTNGFAPFYAIPHDVIVDS